MRIASCIAGQAVLLSSALAILGLRFYARIAVEKRPPILADYLVVGGWLCALSWCIAQTHAIYVLVDHPYSEETGLATSVEYLKSVFVSVIFFDLGLFLPKISMTMFYWWLIPASSTGLRRALLGVSIFVGCAFVATFMSDILMCLPVSDNWSLENQLDSIWFSVTNTNVNWALNISTDAVLFLMPLVIFRQLKLRKAQRWSLVGVFSLGLITMAVSISRFTAPASGGDDVFGTVGAVWCTAEACTGIVVVSLPSLKTMIVGVVEKIGSTIGIKRGESSNYGIEMSGPSSGPSQKQGRPEGRLEAGLYDDELDLEIGDDKAGTGAHMQVRTSQKTTPVEDKAMLLAPTDLEKLDFDLDNKSIRPADSRDQGLNSV